MINEYVLENMKTGQIKKGTTILPLKEYKLLLYGSWKIKSWIGD